MAASRERFLELADECIALSAESDDAECISELLRISHRLLQLADPTLPRWEKDLPEFNREQDGQRDIATGWIGGLLAVSRTKKRRRPGHTQGAGGRVGAWPQQTRSGRPIP
jgi:hypothetical protein